MSSSSPSTPLSPVRTSSSPTSILPAPTSQTRPRSRAYNYTAAVVRGQHPRSVRSASDVFDYVRESGDRCRHVSTGERLYTVVNRGIAAGRPSTGSSLAKLNYDEKLLSDTEPSKYSSSKQQRLLRTFSSPNFHQHMMSKGRKLPSGGSKISPTKYKKFPPPYKKSFLPARISTPQHTLKRPKTKFYYHKVQKVEHRVQKLAKALGMDVTPNEQENIDLSPGIFRGFVPTVDPRKWTKERFSTYFNQDKNQVLLYGNDFGLETLAGSWLGVDRKGRVASHPVPNQTLDEKVTFRFLNFDNLLAYQPLIYGKPVWVVVISGLGDTGAKGWMTGSFLGAKVQKNVALPISEQVVDDDFKKIAEKIEAEGGHIPDANSNVKRNNEKATSTDDHLQFFSKEVGTVRPVSGAIPNNRTEYQMFIEKPTMSIMALNQQHAPLGQWLIRSASGKQDGDYVMNEDEIYLEQDFYYLSTGHVSRDTDACLRQLPHDFKTRKFEEGHYRIDRRGVFKIHLADTNPNNLGLSVSDNSVKELESRAKGSLINSQNNRNGMREYSVIDAEMGIKRPLHGGERFSKDLRLQLMKEQQKLDIDTLSKAERRNRFPHEFFRAMFDECGPPDNDIIARISGASRLGDSESIAGTLAGDSVISKLTYGPVLGGSRPNTVSFSRSESNFRLNTFLDDLDSRSDYDEDYENYSLLGEDSGLISGQYDSLCDSVSLGSTFRTLRDEDRGIYDKLSEDIENEQYEAMVQAMRGGRVTPSQAAPNPETNPKETEAENVSEVINYVALDELGTPAAATGEAEKKQSERRTLMLAHPKIAKEMRLLDDMVPSLLKGYTKENMIKSMKNLDSLITDRLDAAEKQANFNELANFEAMAKDNLKIEQKLKEEREAKRAEEERKEKEKIEKRRSMIRPKNSPEGSKRRSFRGSRGSNGSGGHSPQSTRRSFRGSISKKGSVTSNDGRGGGVSRVSFHQGARDSVGHSVRSSGGSMRSMRGTVDAGIDAVEAVLAKRGLRVSRGTQKAYKNKLKKEGTSMKLVAGEALEDLIGNN